MKRARYEAAGCPSYWVLDPDEPSVIAWAMRGGRVTEIGNLSGDGSFDATVPFPVTVDLSRLA